MTSVFQSAVSNLPLTSTSRLRLLAVSGAVLLAGVGSLSALTYTWDPQGPNAAGSDGSGIWDTTTPDFYNSGAADTTYQSKTNSNAYFGSSNTAGTITVASALKANILKLLPVSGTTGYTFIQNTGNTGSISLTTLNVNVPNATSTINVPLTLNNLNFNSTTNTLSLGSGSAQLGLDTASSPSPNIAGANIPQSASGTLSLNAIQAAAETYTIGTAIAIGNTSANTGGVQVNSGATLTPSAASGALTDLGVGGYAATTTAGNATATNGSGLLVVNSGGTVTTGSTSTVYINNNTGTPANTTTTPVTPASGPGTTALSGRLVVNTGGTLSAGYQIVIGNGLDPAVGNTQSAEMDVTGGVVLLTNNGSSGSQNGAILLNKGSIATAGGTVNATLNISGGVTTLGPTSGITFNAGSSTVGTSMLLVSGGSLFIGNNGLLNGGGNGSSAPIITLSGGIVGALPGGWSTPGLNPVPITLPSNGNVTFQTSNLGAALAPTTFVTATSSSFATASITLNGVLSGAGGFTTTGGGTLVLNAANTYIGPTIVSGGTLLISGNIGATTPAGAVTVNNGGTLLVNSSSTSPSTTGAVAVNSGGTLAGTGVLSATSATVAGMLAPGASTGATSGILTLNTTTGARLTLTGNLLVGVAGTNPNATSTALATNSLLTLSGAVLTVSGTLDGVSAYEVASYGTLTGTFASSNVPANYVIDYNGTSFGGGPDIELDVAPIPEPGSLACAGAALAGLGILCRQRPSARRRGDAAILPLRKTRPRR